MKKTFRFLTMVLLAVGLLASCNKKENNNGGTADGKGFKAMTETSGGNSKTHGVLNADGSQMEVQWTAYDQIKVNNGTETRNFELTAGENTNTGEFYTSEGSTFDFTTGDFYAIYPVANADGVENTVSGNTATFTLPAEQAYLAGSFAEKALPMVAHSNNQTLQFKNVLGGICFPVKGAGLHVTKIVLTSNNGQDKLWGVFTTDCTAAEPVLTYVSGGSNVIELTCNVTLTDEGQDFNIMVPPGTLSTGFSVKIYDGTTVLYDKTVTWTTANNDFMQRNWIKYLNDVIPATTPLTVTTYSPIWISTTTAKTGGEVTGGEFTSLGVIYAKASSLSNPTNDLVLGGTGVIELPSTTNGTIVSDMTGLDINTIYYVRAYAKTADGTVGMVYYGDPIPFATRRVYTDLNGKLPYPFSAYQGREVYFSVGNLQYRASTNTWKFADYQFEFVGSHVGPDLAPVGFVEGSDNHDISPTYSGWIDLFGWGTSGYNHNNDCYQPWSTVSGDNNYAHYYAYGVSSNNLYDGNGKADWGWNNIDNDGTYGENSGWRTLRGGKTTGTPSEPWIAPVADCEFMYLLETRPISKRYMAVRVHVRGNFVDEQPSLIALIIFPDNFEWPTDILGSDAAYKFNQPAELNTGQENQITEAQWSLLEERGAALLPAGGSRSGTDVGIQGRQFYYWASNKVNDSYTHIGGSDREAWGLDGGSTFISYAYRPNITEGLSVRLVRPN